VILPVGSILVSLSESEDDIDISLQRQVLANEPEESAAEYIDELYPREALSI
jgi:hypothetical protein